MQNKNDKLFISYDEAGAEICRDLARKTCMKDQHSGWQTSLMGMNAADLPPGDGLVEVYPVFMQSGWASTVLLPEKLRACYEARGESPDMVFHPVWGSQRGRDAGVNALLAKELQNNAALLVLAHGVKGRELPAEPYDFIRTLNTEGHMDGEMAVAYFGNSPLVEEVLPLLKAHKVVVLPFLMGEGKHMKEDMPTADLAARFGKELRVLPPLGVLYVREDVEGRSGR